MKGTEGLSDLARQMLELAGTQLSKRTVRQLWALRTPATPEEVAKFVEQIRAEYAAEGADTRVRKEKARLRLLERLKKENPEEDDD